EDVAADDGQIALHVPVADIAGVERQQSGGDVQYPKPRPVIADRVEHIDVQGFPTVPIYRFGDDPGGEERQDNQGETYIGRPQETVRSTDRQTQALGGDDRDDCDDGRERERYRIGPSTHGDSLLPRCEPRADGPG